MEAMAAQGQYPNGVTFAVDVKGAHDGAPRRIYEKTVNPLINKVSVKHCGTAPPSHEVRSLHEGVPIIEVDGVNHLA